MLSANIAITFLFIPGSSLFELGTVYPTNQAVYSGSSTLIFCYSSKSVTWKKEEQVITSISPIPNSLLFKNIDESYSGMYTCYGYNGTESFQDYAELFVGDRDNSKIKPPFWRGNKGSKLILRCQSAFNVRWYFEKPSEKVIARSNFLVVNSANLRHSGDYYCYGLSFDKISHFLAKARVKVYDNSRIDPPKFIEQINNTVTFECATITEAKWKFNNGSLPDNAYKINEKLTIEKIDRRNGGVYECKGTTEDGEIFYAGGLLKLLVYENKVTPMYKRATVSQTVEFVCHSKLLLSWFFETGDLPINAKESRVYKHNWGLLRINNVQFSNMGDYTCVGKESQYVIFKATAHLVVDGNCPGLFLNDGSVEQNSNEIGNIASFKCNQGYELIGDFVRQCLPGSKWSVLANKCKRQSTAVTAHNICIHNHICCITFWGIFYTYIE